MKQSFSMFLPSVQKNKHKKNKQRNYLLRSANQIQLKKNAFFNRLFTRQKLNNVNFTENININKFYVEKDKKDQTFCRHQMSILIKNKEIQYLQNDLVDHSRLKQKIDSFIRLKRSQIQKKYYSQFVCFQNTLEDENQLKYNKKNKKMQTIRQSSNKTLNASIINDIKFFKSQKQQKLFRNRQFKFIKRPILKKKALIL